LHLKALGIATGAYEIALKYSKRRKHLVKVFNHQTIFLDCTAKLLVMKAFVKR
jgi:alkylation response protein AidB-like acyl-CoA dehydrogenase